MFGFGTHKATQQFAETFSRTLRAAQLPPLDPAERARLRQAQLEKARAIRWARGILCGVLALALLGLYLLGAMLASMAAEGMRGLVFAFVGLAGVPIGNWFANKWRDLGRG